jgi:hypothetical protein
VSRIVGKFCFTQSSQRLSRAQFKPKTHSRFGDGDIEWLRRPLQNLCVLCVKPFARPVSTAQNRGIMLDSPPNPASGTLVRRGDGLSGQPSETVGGGNLPILISSLDGDRDFRFGLYACLRPSLPTFGREFGMKLPHGPSQRIAHPGGSLFVLGYSGSPDRPEKGVVHEPF